MISRERIIFTLISLFFLFSCNNFLFIQKANNYLLDEDQFEIIGRSYIGLGEVVAFECSPMTDEYDCLWYIDGSFYSNQKRIEIIGTPNLSGVKILKADVSFEGRVISTILKEVCICPQIMDYPFKKTVDITSSNWSIGCEGLDRNLANFANYSDYLSILGAKKARIQIGWARIEKEKNNYDFSEIDSVINKFDSMGMTATLQFSYGNPIYELGGTEQMGGYIPIGDEATVAWDKFTAATLERYKTKCYEWEIWNEPDIYNNTTETYAVDVAQFADFFIRTSEIIKQIQPEAKIFVSFGQGGPRAYTYLESFLNILNTKNKLYLIYGIDAHGYPKNPDDVKNISYYIPRILNKFQSKIIIRQGETGAPSTSETSGALNGIVTSEKIQAKWNARRMLKHFSLNIPLNLFTIADLNYVSGSIIGKNTKGLLKTDLQNNITGVKMAFDSARFIFSFFSNGVNICSDSLEITYPSGVSDNYTYFFFGVEEVNPFGFAIWDSSSMPNEADSYKSVNVKLSGIFNSNLFYVDVVTSSVYIIDSNTVSFNFVDNYTVISNLPICDSPIIVTSKIF